MENIRLIEWFRSQGRFRHLLKEENKKIVEELQRRVDEKERILLARAGEKI